MRDWDRIKYYINIYVFWGLHYLWGIETISPFWRVMLISVDYITYEGLRLSSSSSVIIFDITYRITLSMRDWDDNCIVFIIKSKLMDYITYEGLRLFWAVFPTIVSISNNVDYITYEGLRLIASTNVIAFNILDYITYEGLRRFKHSFLYFSH